MVHPDSNGISSIGNVYIIDFAVSKVSLCLFLLFYVHISPYPQYKHFKLQLSVTSNVNCPVLAS